MAVNNLSGVKTGKKREKEALKRFKTFLSILKSLRWTAYLRFKALGPHEPICTKFVQFWGNFHQLVLESPSLHTIVLLDGEIFLLSLMWSTALRKIVSLNKI